MDRLPTDRRSIVCYLAILEALTTLVSYQSVVEQEAFASNPLTVGILTSGSRSTAGTVCPDETKLRVQTPRYSSIIKVFSH